MTIFIRLHSFLSGCEDNACPPVNAMRAVSAAGSGAAYP
jgi:hypothetical protein